MLVLAKETLQVLFVGGSPGEIRGTHPAGRLDHRRRERLVEGVSLQVTAFELAGCVADRGADFLHGGARLRLPGVLVAVGVDLLELGALEIHALAFARGADKLVAGALDRIGA